MVLEDLEYEHDGDDERAANEIARDMLIPSADLETFLESGRVDRRTIKAFASSQGIAAGIVVGRLQRDDIIGKTQMNDLRQRLEPVRNLGRRGAVTTLGF